MIASAHAYSTIPIISHGYAAVAFPQIKRNVIKSIAITIRQAIPEVVSMGMLLFAYNGNTSQMESVNMNIINNNAEKLDSFLDLKYDWNDNMAEPFTFDHIARCKEFEKSLPCTPDIFPTACGSIQFEYELNNGRYLEFEFYADSSVEMYFCAETGDERYESFVYPEDKELINKEIRAFYEEQP